MIPETPKYYLPPSGVIPEATKTAASRTCPASRTFSIWGIDVEITDLSQRSFSPFLQYFIQLSSGSGFLVAENLNSTQLLGDGFHSPGGTPCTYISARVIVRVLSLRSPFLVRKDKIAPSRTCRNRKSTSPFESERSWACTHLRDLFVLFQFARIHQPAGTSLFLPAWLDESTPHKLWDCFQSFFSNTS